MAMAFTGLAIEVTTATVESSAVLNDWICSSRVGGERYGA
jgi:hypothetical protein